jgi:hypothetical protein
MAIVGIVIEGLQALAAGGKIGLGLRQIFRGAKAPKILTQEEEQTLRQAADRNRYLSSENDLKILEQQVL